MFRLAKMMADYLQGTHQCFSSAGPGEISLVHSAQSGDLDSFHGIVLKHQHVMFHTALRILQQEDLAEDATQEAFLSAYQNLNFFRGDALRAWLMRILINKCYDALRRIQRAPTVSLNQTVTDDNENEYLYTKLHDPAASVEECVEVFQQNEYIQECLSKLPTDFRVILVLIDIEEMSYCEAASILKIPVGTVQSRLARARFHLRAVLKTGEK